MAGLIFPRNALLKCMDSFNTVFNIRLNNRNLSPFRHDYPLFFYWFTQMSDDYELRQLHLPYALQAVTFEETHDFLEIK